MLSVYISPQLLYSFVVHNCFLLLFIRNFMVHGCLMFLHANSLVVLAVIYHIVLLYLTAIYDTIA